MTEWFESTENLSEIYIYIYIYIYICIYIFHWAIFPFGVEK